MRKKNRLLAVAAVLTAVIAACIGVTLSTTEQPVISVPAMVNCGTTMVGGSTTSGAITISPQTLNDDDYITSISENCAEFALNLAAPLPGSAAHVYCDTGQGTASGADMSAFGGSGYGTGACVSRNYTFTATFTPNGPGNPNCPVSVEYMAAGGGSGTATITLTGTAMAPLYAMNINPPHNSLLTYQDIPTGSTSSNQLITITNAGTAALTVTGTNSLPATFLLTPVSPATFPNQSLGVGVSASYNVACRPMMVMGYTGSLTFTAMPGSIVRTVNFTCNGITSSLTITPNPASFARDTIVGGPPGDIMVNILNSGAATTLDEIRIDPNMASGEVSIVAPNPQGTQLATNQSVNVVLHYTAATEHTFGKIDGLIVGDTLSPSNRTITLNAEALPGEIGTTPAPVNFGPVCAGGGTSSRPVEVYATKASRVSLISVTPPATPFDVTRPVGMLQGNHGNAITITASVTPTTAGELADRFVLNTNLPGALAMHSVEMTATGLPPGVTPTPALVHFGPVMVEITTVAKEIVISNCSASGIDITGARIVGADQSDFTIVSPADPAVALPQMGQVTFLVVMRPVSNGTKSAQLQVDYTGGMVTADLDGNGFNGDTGSDEEMGTYYTCSTGAGAGGLPIAFALLAIRRRRRN